jgi:hypothetical protein
MNMTKRAALLAALGLTVFGITASHAGLLSKSFQFKRGTVLEVGLATDDGLRIDNIRFDFPSTVGGRLIRTSGLVRADVAVSNTSTVTHKVGIALALFDEESRLVGVASGGSRVSGLKGGRQRTYKLVFDSVNAEAFKAKTFQVSVETR